MLSQGRYPELLSWKRRLLAASPAVLAHLVLLGFLWTTPSPTTVPPDPAGRGGTSMVMLDLSASAMRGAPPPAPAAPASSAVVPAPKPDADTDPPAPELIAHPEDLNLPAPRTDLAPDPLTDPAIAPSVAVAAGLGELSDPCHLAQSLEAVMEADARVQNALGLIPRDARSVANAIMVWDGQWVAVNARGRQADLAPIRAAIVAGLAAAPANCLYRVNIGPLFVPIVGAPGTTVLAVGSGQWRAIDLISQAAGTQ